MMESMRTLASLALADMPPETHVRPEHGEAVLRNQELLLGLTDDVVQGFYDTLYQHPQTSQVFVDGERPMREKTLADWYERTVRGPLDDDYWAWMALVGLTHVIRRVTNPMMLAMASYVAQFIEERVVDFPISEEERNLLVSAFRRVASMASAIITYAYDNAISSALFEVVGMPEALLERLRDQEVSSALQKAHQERNAG
ncbi:MAG: globin domain protein [Propionibacteriales bacterium]|nr:MAG: globin domain protein [Propionibacteriales bacterium]